MRSVSHKRVQNECNQALLNRLRIRLNFSQKSSRQEETVEAVTLVAREQAQQRSFLTDQGKQLLHSLRNMDQERAKRSPEKSVRDMIPWHGRGKDFLSWFCAIVSNSIGASTMCTDFFEATDSLALVVLWSLRHAPRRHCLKSHAKQNKTKCVFEWRGVCEQTGRWRSFGGPSWKYV